MDTSDEGTMHPLKEFLTTFFMPEKCYDQFFFYFNFMHVPCLKIVLSKTKGILILVGIVIAPLPQIWKVLWSGSSNGLCLTSVFLELLAISTHAAFCYTQNFPIGAWGESLFALIQIAVLTLLVQHYRGKPIKGIYFLAVYCGFMFLLASPLTPVSVVWTLYEWNVLLVIAGRFFQAGSNFRWGHTGQLSALSVFLNFLGSLGRIFSSLQDTGLSLLTQMYVVACCCSGVILAQVLMYWNKCVTNSQKEGQEEKDKAE
ncbi:mannose-P-dolichol utilization defect 1 protein-like [Sinocyclocheilus rhinocerous]|uniref:Solute carrier family 66 member 3 n=1 Tax=Sinocyclocheilus rhinocerous TaxID=307959 RepID=A0A673JHK2_9TELE|nr:PREDICTED: mannose-P-dolichol utilization defect 1 protein-like [Sinocyclocheilus rhinocerous]XP_016391393.1 PREDICTED: mannose-P-dolichol utilization defect 1 protein-like [Sinocyclocheilus rhinocerous]XP_016391394.1 PREDICTED: mannose-P-dolichol utilization defect 1 protein-like [Sinocyclocheilus rhinocerous]